MLWKALQYFWVSSWSLRRRDGIAPISGETYWTYRLWAEGFIITLATAGFSGLAVYGEVAGNTLGWGVFASIATALVGLLELVRVTAQLREQVVFAAQFYD